MPANQGWLEEEKDEALKDVRQQSSRLKEDHEQMQASGFETERVEDEQPKTDQEGTSTETAAKAD